MHKSIYNGKTYNNLCGHFSTEIVIEAIQNGRAYSIDDIIKLLDTDDGTGYEEVAKLLVQAIGNQARVYSYYGNTIQEWTLDNEGGAHAYESKKTSLSSNWSVDESGKNVALERMWGMLKRGHHVIVAGVLDTSTGYMADHIIEHATNKQSHPRYVGHWVVVKRIVKSIGSITIVNPYNNRIEPYNWLGLFKGTMEKGGPYWLIEIAPTQ